MSKRIVNVQEWLSKPVDYDELMYLFINSINLYEKIREFPKEIIISI
jgi:hypothetical protein